MTRDAVHGIQIDALTVDAQRGDRSALTHAVRRALAAQLSSHEAFASVHASALEATLTRTTDRVVAAVLPHLPASPHTLIQDASVQA